MLLVLPLGGGRNSAAMELIQHADHGVEIELGSAACLRFLCPQVVGLGQNQGVGPTLPSCLMPYGECTGVDDVVEIELLIDLSGRNGLRPAEARGLRWSRVDMDERTIRIDAQINRRNEVVKAKTKRSTRVIRFDQATADRLTRWASSQDELRERAAELWLDSQGLLATTARGTPINQRNVHRSFRVISERAGISPAMSGYDLRYTAITHQVERRVPPHKIADWAGTSERMIWEVYRQMLEEVSDVAPIDLDSDPDDEVQP